MSHEVESMAYSGEKPWHGLGTVVEGNLTVPQMLKEANIDWTVSKRPMKFGENYDEPFEKNVNGHYALVRDSDNKVLDVVGERYVPIQNKEAFKLFDDFLKAGNASLETAGSLLGGKMVWGLANLHESFILNGDDKVDAFLLVSAPHQRGKGLLAKKTSIRVVCNNTLSYALNKKEGEEFRMPHLVEFDDKKIEEAKNVLGLARDEFNDFAKQVEVLSKVKVDDDIAKRYFVDLLDNKLAKKDFVSQKEIEEEGNKRIKLALDAYKFAPGQNLKSAKDTAWGLINAITYITDHSLGRNQDNRVFNAWYGNVVGLKKKAFNKALELV